MNREALPGIERVVAYTIDFGATAPGFPLSPLNAAQQSRWSEARRLLRHKRASLANSAGITLGEDYHGDLTRPEPLGVAQFRRRQPGCTAPISAGSPGTR